MKKRLIDMAQCCARRVLVWDPIKDILHARLQVAIESAAASPGGLTRVMSPDRERALRLEIVEGRLANLKKALDAIVEVRETSRVGSDSSISARWLPASAPAASPTTSPSAAPTATPTVPTSAASSAIDVARFL
jgi:hypothetical protein